MSRRKLKHYGEPVYYDEHGRMFKVAGKARVYLNRETVRGIEAKKKK